MAESSQVNPTYWAARESMAVAHRTDRGFLGVTGKAPGDMLLGILTSGLPGNPEDAGDGKAKGTVVYSAVLDSKGRMISDLRVLSDRSGGFLLDFPVASIEAVRTHFRKFLPPRLAKVTDLSDEVALLTVMGPEAATLLSSKVLAGQLSSEDLESLREGEELYMSSTPSGRVRVTPNGDVSTPALDLFLSPDNLATVNALFLDAGAVPLDPGAQQVLRIEKGRPAYGVDMDSGTIPVEAGIHRRAIDYGKGCYTGQEVIIRIRDRGQVNKRLQGLALGDVPVPSTGEQLFLREKEKSVGWVTSACYSPAFGETIALGYLRRGVEAGDSVRLGATDGPVAQVRSLGENGWDLP